MRWLGIALILFGLVASPRAVEIIYRAIAAAARFLGL